MTSRAAVRCASGQARQHLVACHFSNRRRRTAARRPKLRPLPPPPPGSPPASSASASSARRAPWASASSSTSCVGSWWSWRHADASSTPCTRGAGASVRLFMRCLAPVRTSRLLLLLLLLVVVLGGCAGRSPVVRGRASGCQWPVGGQAVREGDHLERDGCVDCAPVEWSGCRSCPPRC